MEDLMQILIYVAFLVIYLLSKVLKSRKEKPVTRQPEEEVVQDYAERAERRPEVGQRQGRSGMDEPERKPHTFEDILRELTGADLWEEQTRQREAERTTYEEQKEKARRQAEVIEQEVERKADQYSEKLSKSVRQAKKAQRGQDKKLQEIEKMTEPLKKKSYRRTKNTLAKEVARSLKNPASAKKAIILSEIINRKHF